MDRKQFQKRLDYKVLSIRAGLWGKAFRALDYVGVTRTTVLAKRNKFRVELNGTGTIWIITSVIKTKKTPFSYTRTRSVFDEDERLLQTAETIASIKKNSEKSIIIVMEGSNSPRINELRARDVWIYQKRSLVLKLLINGPFKGLGEAIQILIVQPVLDADSYIRKISGRYLVKTKLENRPIFFREQAGSAISITYGMTGPVFLDWQNFLGNNLRSLSRGISMEQLLCRFAKENSFEASPKLGVSGRVAVTGGEINV